MEKPTIKSKSYHDYHECRNFLQQKYGYDERDYGGQHAFYERAKKETDEKFPGVDWYNTRPLDFNDVQRAASDYHENLMKNEPPYLDFWHWVVGRYDIHNGCYITFYQETLDELEAADWVKEIYKHYLDEFGNGSGKVEFYVAW